MGKSSQKRAKVVAMDFYMNGRDMKFPPEAKKYQMGIGTSSENEMIITIPKENGIYNKNGNIISFIDNGRVKNGEIITNDVLMKRKQQKEASANKEEDMII